VIPHDTIPSTGGGEFSETVQALNQLQETNELKSNGVAETE
jgi:hypothetical protein